MLVEEVLLVLQVVVVSALKDKVSVFMNLVCVVDVYGVSFDEEEFSLECPKME